MVTTEEIRVAREKRLKLLAKRRGQWVDEELKRLAKQRKELKKDV